MKLKNKKVLVYGMGDSGRAVIKLLHKLNAYVSFYDDDVKFYDQIGFERRPEDVDWDLVVISPGIKCLGNPLLKVFDERKIPVISELDLAYLQSKGKIVAITGTNGKTTVSMLTHRILKMAGFETFLCGNIGLPFSSICHQTNKNSITVCEVSNFQLERSVFFRANVSCILNVRPDHLDRHESFAEYVRVKAKIAQNLRRKDVLILNLNDEQARKLVLHKNFLFFSKNRLKKGVYVWKNQIFVNKKSVLSLSDVNLAGQKNLENVLASVAMASRFGVEKGVYEKLLEDPDTEVKGTVKELAEKYGLSVMEMTGFLDGINDSLAEPNPIEEMEEDTVVSLRFDKEKLYKNMVDAKADWLYNLPQWEKIFDEEKRKELYLEQKKSGTIVKGAKIGRNDPCPCGSGKKYKHCCGKKNA